MNTIQAMAQLRHLYEHLMNGRILNQAEAARGLLGPAIEQLEKELNWKVHESDQEQRNPAE